VDYAR